MEIKCVSHDILVLCWPFNCVLGGLLPRTEQTVALSVSRRLEVEVIFSGAKVDGAGGHWCWR